MCDALAEQLSCQPLGATRFPACLGIFLFTVRDFSTRSITRAFAVALAIQWTGWSHSQLGPRLCVCVRLAALRRQPAQTTRSPRASSLLTPAASYTRPRHSGTTCVSSTGTATWRRPRQNMSLQSLVETALARAASGTWQLRPRSPARLLVRILKPPLPRQRMVTCLSA